MASSQNAFSIELEGKPEYQKLLDGRPQTCGMRSGRVYLEAGRSCGQHSTKDHEELLVFLAGKGVVHIGGAADLEVGRGKVAYIPPRTLHDVENTGTEPLAYIYCVAPTGVE